MKKLLIAFILLLWSVSVTYAQFDDSQNIEEAIEQSAPNEAQQNAANMPGINQTVQQQTSSTGGNAKSEFVPLAKIPGLTDIQPTKEGLANFLNNLYKYLIGFAAVLAIIMIIWGGLQYATQDVPGGKQEGKERIIQAILGLILVLSPVLVFSIINPAILNLSINLDPLKTVSGPSSGSGSGPGGGSGTTTTDPKTGCTVSGTLFKQASCATKKAAEDFSAACSGSGKVLKCQTENSSGCTDTTYTAVCEASSGPYIFLDISYTYNPVPDYQPLVSTPNNQNNGSGATNFTTSCSQDGGVTCVDVLGTVRSVTCPPYLSKQPTSQSNKCYSLKVSCEDRSSLLVTVSPRCKPNWAWNPIK
jgi:hypothetical protein